MPDDETIARATLGAAIEVHRYVGPGFLESTYEICLAHELRTRGISCERQAPIALRYKDLTVEAHHRADLIVAGRVVVELKATGRILPAHVAQVLTYLRWSGLRVGLILDFSGRTMATGIRRVVFDCKQASSTSRPS